tara:strand:+ start:480 stop:713 length:234 start_codon:yes stop_codon:yes gene_type:complete
MTSLKTWKDIAGGYQINLKPDGFPWSMPRGKKETIKEKHSKDELFRRTFIYITDEDELLWHGMDGKLYEVKFKETEL